MEILRLRFEISRLNYSVYLIKKQWSRPPTDYSLQHINGIHDIFSIHGIHDPCPSVLLQCILENLKFLHLHL